MIKSAVCDLLDIKYPLFQGGMAWIADGRLAASVSEAGGLGIIAAGNQRAEDIRKQINIARELTDKPFGLNIMLMSRYADEIAELAVKEKAAAVTTGAGNPSKFMAAWKAAGIKVIPVVASVAMAKMMKRLGADALIAEGGESGGHVGELTTMVLVPLICDAAGELPVIAAGGIADGRGMAAAFMLGAEGVQMGTRFVAAKESIVHENYKQKIIRAKDIDSTITGASTGHPVRCLRNQMTREYQEMEKQGVDFMELEKLTLGSLRRAVIDGDTAGGTLMAGQIAGLVRSQDSCKEIINEIMEQADRLLGR